jgi:hypothetical protein
VTVVWQQVESADDVEATLGPLPQAERPGWLRRWLWAPALVLTAALYVARQLIENPSGEVELWLMLGMLTGAAVTAVAALVRYRDDQQRTAADRGARALADDARSTTGSVVVRERPVGGGRMLRGILAYPTDDGTAETAWSLLVRDIDALEPPRDGDPVAVWWAPGTDVVVARYHRGWADQVKRRTRSR